MPALGARFSEDTSAIHATLLSDHVGWALCGNSDYASPVYTQLYASGLPRAELERRFTEQASIYFYFIDGTDGVVGPKYLPCFHYVLYEGHEIPQHSEPGINYFIAYDWAHEIDALYYP